MSNSHGISHDRAIAYGEHAIRRMQSQGMSLDYIRSHAYILVETDMQDSDGIDVVLMLSAETVRGLCQGIELDERLRELEASRGDRLHERRRA